MRNSASASAGRRSARIGAAIEHAPAQRIAQHLGDFHRGKTADQCGVASKVHGSVVFRAAAKLVRTPAAGAFDQDRLPTADHRATDAVGVAIYLRLQGGQAGLLGRRLGVVFQAGRWRAGPP